MPSDMKCVNWAFETCRNKSLYIEAENYLFNVINDIRNGHFITDQQSFDPQNKVQHISGKSFHGPGMIALDGIYNAYKISKNEQWLYSALEFIDYTLTNHVNCGQYSQFQLFDLWEAVDQAGLPWQEANGMIYSDPGHALEFVGLSVKCLLSMLESENKQLNLAARQCKEKYPLILKRNFQNGFNPDAGGIVKTYDLNKRVIVNSDMPWWSLPETIRSAAEIIKLRIDTKTKSHFLLPGSLCSWHDGVVPLSKRVVVDHG